MLKIELLLEKYEEKGEKTGWTYAKITAKMAKQLKPNTKTSFRVKGKIDALTIKQKALIPIGNGVYILPVDGTMRKKLKKGVGQKVLLTIEEDSSEFEFSSDFLACLEDEPRANEFFQTLSGGHQRYFSKWIESAKTIETKTKRISNSLFGLANSMDYGAMIRHFKGKK